MPFLDEVQVEQAGEVDWRLLRTVRYEAARQSFEVPKGFRTDFASVPGLFQWLIPRSGSHARAAVLHDYLWQAGRRFDVGYASADGIFRRALRELGVSIVRRRAMWAAVRLVSLGRSAFRSGPADIPAVLGVVLFPGILLLAGALVVTPFAIAFWVVEWLEFFTITLLRLHPWFEPVRPGVFWKR